MKVKCIHNTGQFLSSDLINGQYLGWNKEMEFVTITPNNLYIVYAISIINHHKFYMICCDDYGNIDYPQILPYELFEVIEKEWSKYWHKKSPLPSESNYDIGFKEYVEEPYFYGNLLEGYKRELDIFAHWKRLIDEENRDDSEELSFDKI